MTARPLLSMQHGRRLCPEDGASRRSAGLRPGERREHRLRLSRAHTLPLRPHRGHRDHHTPRARRNRFRHGEFFDLEGAAVARPDMPRLPVLVGGNGAALLSTPADIATSSGSALWSSSSRSPTTPRSPSPALCDRVAGLTADDVNEIPYVLIGTVDEIEAKLRHCRDRWASATSWSAIDNSSRQC